MDFNDLKAFGLSEIDRYQEAFSQSDTELADACPNSRIAWNVGYDYRVLDLADCVTLISDGGLFTDPHFALPIGPLTPERLQIIVEAVAEIFARRNWPLKAMFIDEWAVLLFKALHNYNCSFSYTDDLSDYLYKADDLRTLKGHTYRSKRNHCNHFLREYPDFEYRSLKAEDREQALALVRAWCMEKDVDCANPCLSDCRPINELFSAMPKLHVPGGVVTLNGKLIAFTMGSSIHGSRAVIHFEKAHPDYEGLYSFINRQALQEDFATATLVNREEDMGLEGMRIAKQSYKPLRLIRKYACILEQA